MPTLPLLRSMHARTSIARGSPASRLLVAAYKLMRAYAATQMSHKLSPRLVARLPLHRMMGTRAAVPQRLPASSTAPKQHPSSKLARLEHPPLPRLARPVCSAAVPGKQQQQRETADARALCWRATRLGGGTSARQRKEKAHERWPPLTPTCRKAGRVCCRERESPSSLPPCTSITQPPVSRAPPPPLPSIVPGASMGL